MFTLPVVDLMDPAAPTVISKACKDHGFFYLENHGVSEELIQQVLDQSKAFFNLDIEVKMSVKRGMDNPGYTPMGDEITNKANPHKVETKESFSIENEAGTSRRGPNRWPSESLLPGCKAIMTEYFNTMQSLAERVTDLLAVSFGVDPVIFQGCLAERVSDLKEGVIGIGEHSDYGTLTLVATVSSAKKYHPVSIDMPGLQVLHKGEWFDIPLRHGAFICNIGDIVQRWTNDHLRSPVHRVVNKLGHERYSFPFFYAPGFDTKVECLPQFCSEGDPAKYPPTTWGKYLMEKLSELLS